MNKKTEDPFDLTNLRVPDDVQALAYVPTKIRKRRDQFIMVPWSWAEKLVGATGTTYHVAHFLLHLAWKADGVAVKLPNGMLRRDGVSRHTKWRALRELERRGLITIECRPRRSPLVRLNMPQSCGKLVV
jgi:hypothetical protein